MASASCGASPAYMAWKEKTRRNRSSCRNCPTLGASRRNPPMASNRAAAGLASCSGESRFRSMNEVRSSSYSRRR